MRRSQVAASYRYRFRAVKLYRFPNFDVQDFELDL